MNKMTLGDRIRRERLKRGFTQEQFGELLDITSAYVGQLERNERFPSLKVCVNISEKLRISMDYLICGKTENEKLREELDYELEDIDDKEKVMILEIIKIIKKYD